MRGLQTTWNSGVTTLEGHSMTVNSVAYSSAGDRIVSASVDETIRLWDAQTGAQLHTFQDDESVFCAAFSPNGRTIISGSSGGVLRLWDARTGLSIASHEAHFDWVRSVAYSPDGRHAASGSAEKTVKLWKLSPGEIKLVRQFDGHTKRVRCVAFSHDGSFLLSGSSDRTCRVWHISGDSEVRFCAMMNGCTPSPLLRMTRQLLAVAGAEKWSCGGRTGIGNRTLW